jgi:eukaryotic-like serine/threonine-protein kinase
MEADLAKYSEIGLRPSIHSIQNKPLKTLWRYHTGMHRKIFAAVIVSLWIKLAGAQTLADLSVPTIAISPDGKLIALVLKSGDKQELNVRSVDEREFKPVPGTDGAGTPSFSPDGKWIAFFAEGKLKKVAVDSGQIVTICDGTPIARGAVWGSDDRIIFTPDTGSALLQVPASGGMPKPLTERKDERSHRWPEMLPGNKAVLYTIAKGGSWDDAQIVGQRLDTGERRVVIDGGTAPRYLSTGHLIYVHGGALMAVPFDPDRMQVTGTAAPLVQGVFMEARAGAAQFSVSRNGTLVYIPTNVSSTDRTMVWVNRDGSAEPLKAPARAYEHPRLSPDGKRVIVGITGDSPNVFLYDIASNALKQFTTEGNNALPIWTPDGKRVAFRSTKPGAWNAFLKSADGSGGINQLTSNQYLTEPSTWSPDGKLLIFTETDPVSKRNLWILPLTGDRTARPLIQTPADESAPRFSPDGRWLAYVSDSSGRPEIYVQSYPISPEKWHISIAGGREPVWAPNGAELFYRDGDKLMVAEIKTRPAFAAAKPRVLFTGGYEGPISSRANFDISPDGRRFLMLQAGRRESTAEIKIVPNLIK